MIEHRELIIYEIEGRKVGSSIQGESRPQSQLRDSESYTILQVIAPNSLTVRESIELESDWSVRRGYLVERFSQMAFTESHRTGLATKKRVNALRNKIDEEGRDGFTINNLVRAETMRNTIDEDGFTAMERMGQKLSATRQSEEWREGQRWICSHCGKEGMLRGNYTRWHGDNCKHKK